ncbi:MAG: dihydrofolate reductase family protein [Sphingobacteriales bacterium]
MRKVICALNITIDGCYDHTKVNGSEEILEFFTDLMSGVDQVVTGRKMFELMSPHWREVARTQSGTKAANAFAKSFSTISTTVISRTLEQVEGGPRIIRDGLEDEVRRLKQLPGKKISIGGMTVRSQLMAAGLIDELYVVVHPVIAGTGPRLFEDISLAETLKMELADTRVLGNGCVVLGYLKPC